MYSGVSPAASPILVLDDEPAILAVVSGALRQAGFMQVSTSSSIAGARQCWHAQIGNFDLLLSDFSLPDGCAPDFIQDLLRHKPTLQIILMSGYSEDVLALEGEWTQQVKVLSKPFRASELIALVEATLRRVALS